MLSVIMLNVNVIMLSVVILSVIMLNIIILSVVMLNVVMLSVAAPQVSGPFRDMFISTSDALLKARYYKPFRLKYVFYNKLERSSLQNIYVLVRYFLSY
jgi:hypothetical protein